MLALLAHTSGMKIATQLTCNGTFVEYPLNVNCQDKKHIGIFFDLYNKSIFEVVISSIHPQNSLSMDQADHTDFMVLGIFFACFYSIYFKGCPREMQALGSVKQHFWHPNVLAAALFLKFHLNIVVPLTWSFIFVKRGWSNFNSE